MPYLSPPATDDCTSSASCLEDDASSELGSDSTAEPDTLLTTSSVLAFKYTTPTFYRILSEDSSDDDENIRKASKMSSPAGMKIYVISSSDSAPAIAKAAKTLASRSRAARSKDNGTREKFSIPELDSLVTAEFPPPQLLIVHDVKPVPFLSSTEPSLELDAFPPWHLRLTELHRTSRKWSSSFWWNPILRRSQYYNVLSQEAFRHALDEYEKAEMREGK